MVFPKWDRCPKVVQYPNALCSSFRGCFVILLYEKSNPIIKIMSGASVPKVGHGPEMGQNEFDCACVSVVFTCTPLVFHSPYIKPVGHGSIGLLQAPVLASI